MTISPTILDAWPSLNEAQKEIVGHGEGPLLVIAGPGSGKTHSLVLRALNLLLLERAKPSEIVVCTFTEKAAFELRDRLSEGARRVGYAGDLSELRASTIHGLAYRNLALHRHRTRLGAGFETLDELGQILFLYDHFDEIAGEPVDGKFLGRWTTKWGTIEALRTYFDKITEELVDPSRMRASADPFLSALGASFETWERRLAESNRLDFAHQQRLFHDLLLDPDSGPRICGTVRYVLVDEYQDTNFVQERILFLLVGSGRNLTVVGDEDQALYRFRGATVRNILEFPERMPGARLVRLTTNYRSHPDIVHAYDRWMASADWSNRKGAPFRFEKSIGPAEPASAASYPAIFSIWGRGEADEASRVADLVSFLLREKVVEDASQIALLFRSVREERSGSYLEALEKKGIAAFCPRARGWFDNEEVRLMVACFALVFGWHGEGRGEATPGPGAELARYVDEALTELARATAGKGPLVEALRELTAAIETLTGKESLDLRPADLFYRFLSTPPFSELVRNENRARNLAIFSQLLNAFQLFYHHSVVTASNRIALRFQLFGSFFRLLHEGGINEYEDPNRPFPKGHVQVLTIHQAKGLEFPVVIVGSLDQKIASSKQVDRDLAPFFARPPFEPEERITTFDRMRLHYVAFSRPEKILVLTCASAPKPHFAPIWEGLPQWPYVEKGLLAAQSFSRKARIPPKRSFSFTGDLRVYETCPRQYQFFREWDFTPSRSAVIFFGLLVHQTIEEFHRLAMDGQIDAVDESRLRELFDRTFSFLALQDVRPIGQVAKEAAFRQVRDYLRQNREAMRRIVATEVDVSVEMEGYILSGKVDLVLGEDGRLELLDFKSSRRPRNSPELIEAYERQLATYAHILEKRHRRRVDRLFLYWTGEEEKSNALQELRYRPDLVEGAAARFELLVTLIRERRFDVVSPPESATCKECDLRRLCAGDGTIRPAEEKA